MNKKIFFSSIIILFILLLFLLFPKPSSKNNENGAFIYIAYSPSCPHCHHLLNYLDSIQTNISIYKTTNGKLVYDLLKKYNYSWDFSVPITFALVNNSLFIIRGYPSESQDKNGYFYGENYEKQLCLNFNGTLIYNGSKYLFCKLKNGEILGNKYAIDYLINLCEQNLCKLI